MNRFLAATLLLLGLTSPLLAQDAAPKVTVRLVAEQATAKPGGTITVALEQKIAPGWHTYWINPGDVGQPTSIEWALPPGWSADALQWATPQRLPVGPFMDYGYEGKVWLLANLAVPADARVGDTLDLKATAHFLVCEKICIPEDASLTLPVKIGDGAADEAVAKDFAAARALMPVASPWKITTALNPAALDIYVAAPALVAAHPADVQFFPLQPKTIKNPAPQSIGYAADGLVLRLTPDPELAFRSDLLTGVLVMKSTDGSVQAISVNAAPGAVPAVDFPTPASTGDVTLLLAVALAFLGGLILNAMPCVLPILAMKALALAAHAGKHSKEAAAEGFAYSAGAVASFLIFGLVIVALRQTGQAVGWGFQMQEPIAVAGFALLTFAVGLNLSGVFEFGSVTMGDGLASRSGAVGAFFTGVLAVAVAAPCTAPFMAAALGFALSQNAASALLIFLSLGLGFALPFLILGLWPRALSFLPRPGPWMLRLKQFLAFPMYGAAAWLAWVLAQEAGANGVAILLGAFLLVAFAAWLWSVTRDLAARGRTIGTIAALALLIGTAYGLTTLSGATAPPPATSLGSEKFTPEKLASLRAAGTPVFVDATAAWCITCLVNEQAVLSRASIKNAFSEKKVTYLVADWTNADPAITKLLEENGRSGVPLYLYYAPGAQKAVLLPQILTEAGVLSVLGT